MFENVDFYCNLSPLRSAFTQNKENESDLSTTVIPKDLVAWQALNGRKTRSAATPKFPNKTTDVVTANVTNYVANSGKWWSVHKEVVSQVAKPKKGGFTMYGLGGVDELDVTHPSFANLAVISFYSEAIRANPALESALHQAENVALATVARCSLKYQAEMVSNYIVQMMVNGQADPLTFPGELTRYMDSIQMAVHCVISPENLLHPPPSFCVAHAIDPSWCTDKPCSAPHRCPICGVQGHSMADCTKLESSEQAKYFEKVRRGIRNQVSFQARPKKKYNNKKQNKSQNKTPFQGNGNDATKDDRKKK